MVEIATNTWQKIRERITTKKAKKMAAISMLIILIFMGILSAVLIVPGLFGIKVFAVATGSMEPLYPVGSLVFAKPTPPDTIDKDDCITYQFGTETITHRVIRVNLQSEIFITQGDRNQYEDIPVKFENLIGKTAPFSLPFLGYFVIWAHQINYWILILAAGLFLSVFAGQKIYLLWKRRKTYEAQC
ncbi:signal peptidase I [Scatolibacter rhodanostii]|uniref:signal peptidase I n=1 Tax=Scatolibacter rhodanostii TaxID=2014781 RepID=UPI000C070EBC|nr:signal peptidase I [Scatolibacter rhodanostii]